MVLGIFGYGGCCKLCRGSVDVWILFKRNMWIFWGSMFLERLGKKLYCKLFRVILVVGI